MKAFLIMFVAVIIGYLGVWAWFFAPARPPTNKPVNELAKKSANDRVESESAEWQAQTDRVIRDWLTAQKRGENGAEFWATDKDYVHPVSFYNVIEYKVVDNRFPYERVVSVHSTTKGGSPIVQLWRVWVVDGKITWVRPADERHWLNGKCY